MSLRYTSKVFYQVGMRGMQGIKDQASKCEYSTIKTIKDSTCSSSSSSCSTSKQAIRRFSCARDSNSLKGRPKHSDEKLKQAEESLRTVMYLSCWGPS